MAEEKKNNQAVEPVVPKDDSHLVGGKLGIGSYLSYACGALGHDMFYGTLSTYFMMFVTSQLFPEGMEGAGWVSILTFIITIIRIVELCIDPMIGGIIDNTKTRFGKFKPWIMIGAIIAGIGLIAIFTDFGGLSTSSPITYLIVFAIVYLIMDIFYSFKDIAFWSMMPALSLLNRDREKLGTVARVASTIGQQVVTLSIVPAIAFFQTAFGCSEKISWNVYAIIIAVAAALLALITCIGTKENDSAIIKKAEKVQLASVFKNLIQNRQLMWCALVYCIFALSTTVTNSLSLYYFKYIFGAEQYFPLVGTINLISGLIALVLFPILTKFLTRKQLFVAGGVILVIGYIIYFNAGSSVPLVFTGVVLTYFPQPLMALIFFMLISDCVEYGQWKLGKRAESAT
ncbi:MAG: MFS transporter, partial [Enterococcus sp.]|nr:MFS transporter [Enterococcus sp.]